MTIAIILVIAAVLGLIFILSRASSRSLKVSADASLAPRIQPVDIEAFRNLVDPAETDYLRQRLPAGEFRAVQRKRLLAMAAYIRTAKRNAHILAGIAAPAQLAADPRTAAAARELIDNAATLKRNATFTLLRIGVALAWPDARSANVNILVGYERLNGSAMLLGRLQNPAAPVRVSAH
jgi:hypothetical protein